MARGFGSRGRVVRSDAFLRSAMGDWGSTVYGLALARTCSPADAQDVYQDVFVRLATDGTEFSDGEHLKAWLVRVTLNRCRDLARSPWRRRTVPLDEVAEAADPVEVPEASLAARELIEAVACLPPKLREVVYLSCGMGLDCNEAAELLGVRPATVRTRLHRARLKLRETMGGTCDDEQIPDGERGPLHTGLQAR